MTENPLRRLRRAQPGIRGDGRVLVAERVAQVLLNQYLLAFELISVILLVAIIGALSLGKIERRQPWK